jgi:hypothetical protein
VSDLRDAAPPAIDHAPLSLITFELHQRPRRDGGGWRLINDQMLAYSMWYQHWHSAISYAAFAAKGQELAVRTVDQTSALRKLVLILPSTIRNHYTDGLRFPACKRDLYHALDSTTVPPSA